MAVLLPHALAWGAHTDPGADTHVAAYVLDRTAAFLQVQGDYQGAIRHFERAVAAKVGPTVRGEERPGPP